MIIEKIKKSGLLLILLVSLIGLIACAPTMISGRMSAATFQAIPENVRFYVLGSGTPTLTERHIQDLIEIEMKALGYESAESLDQAELAITYSYAVGGGNTVVSSSPDFVQGGQRVRSSTTYPRHFEVIIFDINSSLEKGEDVVAWQSEIYSTGSSQNVSWLADRFVPKLFEKFGESATNERFTIPTTAPIF